VTNTTVEFREIRLMAGTWVAAVGWKDPSSHGKHFRREMDGSCSQMGCGAQRIGKVKDESLIF
jgi:hypothetical protein